MYGPVTTLSQTLAGAAGQVYQVTRSHPWDSDGCSVSDPGCGNYHNYFDASFNGQTVLQEHDATETDAYVEYQFLVTTSFNPALNNYLLQFDSTNDDDVFFLDDVSVKSNAWICDAGALEPGAAGHGVAGRGGRRQA